jgi:putative oxidoreductase
MAIGLLILRIVVGVLMIGHGTQKLFGWFGGGGITGTAGFFDGIGLRPARPAAVGAGIAEAGGGLLLALGLLTPIGSVAIVCVMVGAIISVHWPKVWNTQGGLEYPLVMLTCAWALSFAGPGRWSFDRALELDLSGTLAGLMVLAIGVVCAFAVILLRRRPVTAAEPDAAARNAPTVSTRDR